MIITQHLVNDVRICSLTSYILWKDSLISLLSWGNWRVQPSNYSPSPPRSLSHPPSPGAASSYATRLDLLSADFTFNFLSSVESLVLQFIVKSESVVLIIGISLKKADYMSLLEFVFCSFQLESYKVSLVCCEFPDVYTFSSARILKIPNDTDD